jgi:chromosome segregation ATPase
MELEKDTYTKEEVQELLANAIQEKEQKIAEFQTKVQEYEQKITELQNLNLQSQIKSEMFKSGLSDDLFDLVFDSDVEKAKQKIAKLASFKQAQTPIYQPTEHKKEDAYTKAEQKGDVKTMLNAKLAKLFS